MVKKLAILGFILVVVAATGMVWAGTFSGAIPAPTPTVMPAAAPVVCGPAGCAVPAAPAKVKAPPPKRLSTTIEVSMKYPQPAPPPPPVYMGCGAPPPPIPVAVPMWKFIVPWPPFVYYLPVK
ncbi:MAG: hypothetical protein LDL33_09550 [Desulfomonile sp.]|nr:hypothetical protein [Desulfomonile sp.]